MSRTYFRASIEELEHLASGQPNGPQLQTIVEELGHRNSDRAERLRAELEKRLSPFADKHVLLEKPQPTPPSATPRNVASLQSTSTSFEPQPTEAHTAYPPIRNKAPDILKAWTSLEVLSPTTFERPDKLAGGDSTAVVALGQSPYPWERGARSKPNYRLYYQIVLGSIRMEPAVKRLIDRFGDSRDERPSVRGSAALAVVLIDQKGFIVEKPAVAVSSFGWGVAVALTGGLSGLAAWQDAEAALTEMLDAVFRPVTTDAEETPNQTVVDRTKIEAAYRLLTTALKLDADLLDPPSFAIKSYQYFTTSGPPDALLLNSFFLGDLSFSRNLLAQGKAPKNLLRYLGVEQPAERHDLLTNIPALDESIAPKRTPLARWPANGRHPLVLLQQAAVNLSFSELATGGVVGINGPPGTGKTTLLRDIVAEVVRQRADAMVRFDDPEKAFGTTGQRIKAGNGWIHLYDINSTLRGHEVIVASSNNNAVKNVSAELPGIAAIAPDADQLRYLSTLSDALHGKETWGLIAAVLGNLKNRAQFRQTFWWDKDVGLNVYLSTVNGASPQFEERDPETNEITKRTPRIVEREKPPADHAEALKRWKAAAKYYTQQKVRIEKELSKLESLRADVHELARLAACLSALQSQAEAASQQVELRRAELKARSAEEDVARVALARTYEGHKQTVAARPGFFARLFNTTSARSWRVSTATAAAALQKCGADHAQRADAVRVGRSGLAQSETQAARANDALVKTRQDIARREQRLQIARDSGHVAIADEAFYAASHRTKQLSVAWLGREVQLLRDELFVAAIGVHRAFIDAAARPLKHNIGALMTYFSGQPMPDAQKESLRSSLWSSLFIVVPVLSTTFASVERMLGRLPPGALGWLLVDEAGQALPQAVVGALVRSQRVVMVGDPVQIEPVVALPDKLASAICRTFGVDPDRYAAPAASAQTLADSASPYASEIETRDGSRSVGIPLLVHRRCADPMFSVANSVAYAGMMVSSKAPAHSPIRELLGPSSWTHVEGSGEDKWCEEEGRIVLELLTAITAANCKLDIYTVTPFVIVADRLRQAILKSGVLDSVPGVDARRWVYERVGTVHTVQGREAEAVVFVLGAPLPQQRGARGWAGGRPNLLNVAVTRAKEALYVVGNRQLWEQAGVFRELANALPLRSR
jgi:AAA domain